MKFIGYLIIIWSALNLLINISRLLSIRKMKRNMRDEFGGEASVNAAFAGLAEYDWGLVILSLGALPIGIYLALNGATFGQLAGFALLLMSLGGVIQSFRPIETGSLLAQSGDYQTSVNSMAWKLRTISAIELAIGLYLITWQ